MKVEALMDFNDLECGVVREKGEVFDVTDERLAAIRKVEKRRKMALVKRARVRKEEKADE